MPENFMIEHYSDGDQVNCHTETSTLPASDEALAIWGPAVRECESARTTLKYAANETSILAEGFMDAEPDEKYSKPAHEIQAVA
jgi:hypothetical protein